MHTESELLNDEHQNRSIYINSKNVECFLKKLSNTQALISNIKVIHTKQIFRNR